MIKPDPLDKPEQRLLSPQRRLDLFIERASAALTHVHVCQSEEAAIGIIEATIGNDSYVDTGCRQYALLLEKLTGPSKQEQSEDHDVIFSISEASIGVALTGSCVLDGYQHRGGSLLPPRHIILLNASDIVEDLYAAYEMVAESLRTSRTSVFAFHTGPSRSADIEQTMALGVHGPGDVHVLVFAFPYGE
jgi:L-lactate dehydrogenase complex protein LldG